MAKRQNFNKGRITKIAMPKSAGSWLTNAGKSLGMASMDILTDIMPASVELAQNAAQYASDFKSHMDEMKAQTGRMKQAMDRNVYMDILRTAKNNTINDIKSGNLYHRASYDDGLGDMDFGDMDFGEDWDVGDDGDYDVDFSSEDGQTQVSATHKSGKGVDATQVRVNVDVGENSTLVQAMDNQTKVYADAAKVSNEYTKAFNRSVLAEMSKLNESTSGLLSSIDSNITTMVSVGETLAKSASLSAKYYEDSMAAFNLMNESLTAIKTSVAGGSINGDTERYNKNGKYENILDNVVSGNGILDLGKYAELIKKQGKQAVDSNFVLSSIFNMVSDTDTLKSMFEHPINMVTQGIMKKFIPNMMREAATSFDKMLQETTVSALYGLRGLKHSDNPILEFLGKTFGISNELKSTVDKSNYNRGRVDWNGESHKTLNEVIPYYLRKIASAVSGTEEMVYDYDKGVFGKLSDIQKDYKKSDERKLLSEFSGNISDFKEFLGKTTDFADGTEAQKKAIEDVEKLLMNLVKKDGRTVFKRNGSYATDLARELDGRNPDDPVIRMFSAFLNTRSNAEVASLFNRQMLDARNAFSKYKIREEAGEIATNGRYVDNGEDNINQHLKLDKSGKITGISYKNSPFIERNEYGKSTLNYVSDIYKLLINGIIVFPSMPFGGALLTGSPNASGLSEIQKHADRLREYLPGFSPDRDKNTPGAMTEEQIQRAESKGRVVVDLRGEGGTALEQQLTENYKSQEAEDRARAQKESWFTKYTGIDPDRPISKLFNNISDLLKHPGELGTKMFQTADNFLFKMVFGDYENKDGGLFKKAFAHIKVSLRKGFTNIMKSLDEKILGPIHEKLFGDEGIFTKIKNSQISQDLKKWFSNIGNFVIGTKGTDGLRHGGLLSDTANELSDIGHSMKEALIGKNEGSVLSEIKAAGRSAGDSIARSLGIDLEERKKRREDPTYSPIKDAMHEMSDHIKMRGNQLMDTLFGPKDVPPKDEKSRIARAIQDDVKEMGAGKLGAGAVLGAGFGALAGSGSLGIITSLFMPGGVIGGALLGMGISIAKNSRTVQDILFGKVQDDGTRPGGLIMKDVSDAFAANKNGIIAGTLAGTAGAIGLIPSFFVPGGPVGGALIGMGVSMALKSENIQKFLFGDEENGSKGILGKIGPFFKNAEGVTDKGRFMDAGIGAGIGLIGGMFLPTGPIGTALLGSALGFAASSEGFQKFLFGEKNEDGSRSGGVIGKLSEKVTKMVVPLVKSTQIKMMGWLEEHIMIPLMDSFRPIANAAASLVSGIANKVTGMFKFIGHSITTFLIGDGDKKKGILTPLLNVGKFIGNSVKKVSLAIISAPFKLIEGVAKAIDLGTRLKNVASHLISPVMRVATDLIMNPLAELKEKVSDGIRKMWDVVNPFKHIGNAIKGIGNFLLGKKDDDGIRHGGAIESAFDMLGQTGVGKAAGHVKQWYINGRNAIGGTFGGMATSRMKLQKIDGKWVYAKDKDYEYNNTSAGESVGHMSKRHKLERQDWTQYQLYYHGTAKDKKKAEKYFRNKYKDRAEELLNSGMDMMDREKFDNFLGLQSDGWKHLKPSDAVKDAQLDRNAEFKADEIISTEMKTQKMVVEGLDLSDNVITELMSMFSGNSAASAGAELEEYLKNGGDPKSFKARVLGYKANKYGKKKLASEDSTLEQLASREEARQVADDMFLSEVFGDGPIPGTSESEILNGETKPEDKGGRAFGGKILETGKYWLSKGERVISNIKGKYEDYRKEKALKHKYDSQFGDKNFTSDDTGEAQDGHDFTTSGKSKIQENAERAATQYKGSYENRMKLMEEEAKAEADAHFRNTIMDKIDSITDAVVGQAKTVAGAFDLKKGLITMALAGLVTMFPDLVKDIGEWLGNAIVNISRGLESVGGIKGLINNVGEQVDKVATLLGLKTKDHVTVNEDGTISLNEDGTVATHSDTTKKGWAGRLFDYVFPEQTRIDVDGSKTGDIGSAYTDSHVYDSASGAKLNILAQSAARVATSKPAKLAYRIAKGADGLAGKAFNSTANFVKNAANGNLSKAYKLARGAGLGKTKSITKAIGFVNDTSKGNLAKAYKIARSAGLNVETSGAMAKSAGFVKTQSAISGKHGLIGSFIEYVGKGIKWLTEKAASFVTKHGGKTANNVLKILKNVSKNLTESSISKLSKAFLDKVKTGISKLMAKLTASVSTGTLLDWGFGLAGAISGLCNFENMFQVDAEDLTFGIRTKLRLIAGFFKAITSTSYGGFLDLADCILQQITGTSFLTELALGLFNAISSEEDEDILNNARTEFFDEYEKYSQKEYEEYVKHAQESGQTEVMDYDTFKQSSVATTFDDYNMKQHQTIGSKIWNGVKGVGSGIAKGAKAVGGGIAKAGNWVVEKVKALPGAVYNLGQSAANVGKKAIAGVKNIGLAAFDDMKSMYKGITGISSIFKGSYWKAPQDDGKGFDGPFRSMMFYAQRITSLPHAMLYGVGQSAKNIGKKIFSAIPKIVSTGVEDTKSMYSGITGVSSIFKGDYWKAPTDTNQEMDGPFRSVMFYAQRITSLPHALVYGIGQTAKNIGKKLFDGIKNIGAAGIEDTESMYKGIEGVSSVFTGDYWTPPSDDGQGFDGPFRSVLFYAQRVTSLPHALVYGVGKSAKNIFGKAMAGLKNVFDKDLFDVDDVTLEDYWKKPESSSDEGLGIFSTVAFYISRAIMFPFKLVKTIMAKVEDLVENVKETFSVDFDFDFSLPWGGGNGGTRGMSLSGNGSPDMVNGFPYYSQTDDNLKNKPYKLSDGRGFSPVDQTMGDRGCGPTALAMVASKLKGGYGNPYTPENMARLAEQGNYSTSAGTTPGYFMDVGTRLGMNVTPAPATGNNIETMLRSGQPVIIQGRSNDANSPFTSGGHYVVGVGMSGNRVVVNDPNGRASSKAYSMNQITNGSHLAFGFSGMGPGDTATFGSSATTTTPSTLSETQQQEKALINCMAGLENKNTYTQNGKPYDSYDPSCPGTRNMVGDAYTKGHGYGDCSATVRWVYKTCLGIDVGSYTGAQIGSSASRWVDQTSGGPNLNNLRPGDLLFYRSKKTGKVGHVEMYMGNNMLMGHGSGTGPTKKTASTYRASEYMGARRVIKEGVTHLTGEGKQFLDGKYNGKNLPAVTYDATSTVGNNPTIADASSSSSSGGLSSFVSILGSLASSIINPIKARLYGSTSSSDTGSLSGAFTSAATSSYASSISPSSNAISNDTDETVRRDAVYKKLRSMGYSKEAAAGVMGNLKAESSFRPTVLGDGGHAFGLAQWHSYKNKSGRWLNLSNYAKSIGSDYTNIEAQTEFLDKEMDPSVAFRDTIAANAIKKNFGSMDGFRKSNDLAKVTEIMMTKFERPANQSREAINGRIAHSKAIYDHYVNSGMGGFGPAFKSRIGGGMGSGKYRPIHHNIGGYGNYSIDRTMDAYEDRIRSSGGFGGYDDSSVVNILSSMLSEMKGTNAGINKFNEKDFSGGGNTINYYDGKSTDVTINESKPTKKAVKNPGSMINPQLYALGKKIASGQVTM